MSSDRHPAPDAALAILKRLMLAQGYRFEVSPDGLEERMFRPDGTLALSARRDGHVRAERADA